MIIRGIGSVHVLYAFRIGKGSLSMLKRLKEKLKKRIKELLGKKKMPTT